MSPMAYRSSRRPNAPLKRSRNYLKCQRNGWEPWQNCLVLAHQQFYFTVSVIGGTSNNVIWTILGSVGEHRVLSLVGLCFASLCEGTPKISRPEARRRARYKKEFMYVHNKVLPGTVQNVIDLHDMVAFSFGIIFGTMFDHLFPACAPPPLLFFEVEINSRTIIPLFMPGSVHSGSASWDDCGRTFPDKLRVSSFPFPR